MFEKTGLRVCGESVCAAVLCAVRDCVSGARCEVYGRASSAKANTLPTTMIQSCCQQAWYNHVANKHVQSRATFPRTMVVHAQGDISPDIHTHASAAWYQVVCAEWDEG